MPFFYKQNTTLFIRIVLNTTQILNSKGEGLIDKYLLVEHLCPLSESV